MKCEHIVISIQCNSTYTIPMADYCCCCCWCCCCGSK